MSSWEHGLVLAPGRHRVNLQNKHREGNKGFGAKTMRLSLKLDSHPVLWEL